MDEDVVVVVVVVEDEGGCGGRGCEVSDDASRVEGSKFSSSSSTPSPKPSLFPSKYPGEIGPILRSNSARRVKGSHLARHA